jgi:hypothetical protein
MHTAPIIGSLAEIEGQSGIEQKTAVDLRLCRACSAEMRDHDKFSRRCGARQAGEEEETPPLFDDLWTASITLRRMTASLNVALKGNRDVELI